MDNQKAAMRGFSKLNREEKISWLAESYLTETGPQDFQRFLLSSAKDQKLVDEFSENTLTSFPMPYGIIPNLKLNQKILAVPMVTEESSVVAAASKSALFWFSRGGTHAKTLKTTKSGQVHFEFEGDGELLQSWFEKERPSFLQSLEPFSESMRKRGGGVLSCDLVDERSKLENYFQLDFRFETCDAMGANFINTLLEAAGRELRVRVKETFKDQNIEIIMAILSNYSDECLVHAHLGCPVSELEDPKSSYSGEQFAKKFKRAVDIATVSPKRAVTHNKGILNGIDGVVLATGNDFRAVEACIHAYAARDGQYRSLSKCHVNDGYFSFELTVPLALGTVGGLTSLHPLAKTSFEILKRPNASELMEIVASVGLLQNFAAISSLVTTGIQKGHMKMHLLNILGQLGANTLEKEKSRQHFKENLVSFGAVRDHLNQIRQN